jgi:hypothetical protein
MGRVAAIDRRRGRRARPRIHPLLVTSGRRVVPLRLRRQPPAVPDAKRERLVPGDTSHRLVLVGSSGRGPGRIDRIRRVADDGRLQCRRVHRETRVPRRVPAGVVRVVRVLAGACRNHALRICRYEISEPSHRDLVSGESEVAHRGGVALVLVRHAVVTPIEGPARHERAHAA